MKATHRLTSADFRSLRATRRVSGDFFTLSIAASHNGIKYAVVVSKKVSAKAVIRNLVKRRFRAAAQKLLRGVHEPFVFIFHAKREAAAAPLRELERDIASILKRARG